MKEPCRQDAECVVVGVLAVQALDYVLGGLFLRLVFDLGRLVGISLFRLRGSALARLQLNQVGLGDNPCEGDKGLVNGA